jgi:hypothetical protein
MLALDHLHTETPALAGDASRAEVAASVSGVSSRRRGPSAPRRFLAVLVTAVLAGIGVLVTETVPASAATDPFANSVLGFHGAPPIGPNPGLTLNAGFAGIAAARGGKGYWVVASDGGVFSFGNARFKGSTGGMKLAAPVVGIAGTRSGNGYWLVGLDGGVFSFGDAKFYGSMGGKPLRAPIVSMAATPSGNGYWLVASDGGVFAFGDARFKGSAAVLELSHPIVAMTPSRRGGYYLLASDGGVFAYGNAPFFGANADPNRRATGIAVARNNGYWVAHSDGSVDGFGVPSLKGAIGGDAKLHPSVAIAAAPNGFWLVQSKRNPPAPPAPPAVDLSQHPFLKCTRAHESDSAGGYRAISPGGTYRGAYQFLQSTWNNVARSAGRADLVGVDPAAASPHDQDLLALTLYRSAGAGPWGGRCAGM